MTKKYEFKLTIVEGSDEFWEDATEGSIGCDHLKLLLSTILSDYGFDSSNSDLVLTKYEDS